MFFRQSDLKCSGCGKNIKNEENLVAYIKLPKAHVMPYGAFDIALAKYSTEILCDLCNKKK
ncbi:hypothetical protein P4K49_31690 [Bacillus cereus]|uniref:hypothetical protein n=1 Tax=Bacillus cereus group TaxID=86661 RepID=UPI000676B844|nr:MULTISPECIES: hypothetical protein [Bacillus cereus group]MRB43158.1 hypothetical protein [Bacillus thuringiensis]AKR38489.1 Hypothetical protein NF53_p1008 [Bacillus thuringiensis serovar indiana]MDZ4411862.1 hypothetical protein [Bacillus cereus]MEB8879713.1 hypothetical protein [Bacillus cereus]MEB9619121.1 hypothetical protein [Bacillus cereus]